MIIFKRYRNVRRIHDVALVLIRHGFGYLLGQLGLTKQRAFYQRGLRLEEARPLLSKGERLRLVLDELGPTFVKLGQVLSTRPDLLPEDIRSELARLQEQVHPFPFAQVQFQIRRELGRPLEEVYSNFDAEPLAAASIGQVHRARLHTGEEVVVKVQRPGIEEVVTADMEILFDIAQQAEKRTNWGKAYQVSDVVEEFRRTLMQEMDYLSEGRNANHFRSNFSKDPTVYIPAVFWQYTTSRILTMEYVTGVMLGDILRSHNQDHDLEKLARRLARATFQQILIDGFFHADLHPGNVAVLPGERIALMDFGMAGRLAEERQQQLSQLLLGLVRHQSGQIVRVVAEMGVAGKEVDLFGLRRDVDILRDRYYDVPLSEVKIGKAIGEILNLAFKYQIRIPAEFGLVAKALITMEGVVEELDPGLSIVEVAEPFGRRLMRERMQPKRLWSDFSEQSLELGNHFLQLPGRLDRLLEQAEDGRLTVKLEHVKLEEALSRADRISNRFSFSIGLLAFSIIITGFVVASALIAGVGGGFLWMRLPFLEIGFVAVLIMGVWLLLAIFRSGRL